MFSIQEQTKIVGQINAINALAKTSFRHIEETNSFQLPRHIKFDELEHFETSNLNGMAIRVEKNDQDTITLHFTLPPLSTVTIHSHPDCEETVTVLAGSLYDSNNKSIYLVPEDTIPSKINSLKSSHTYKQNEPHLLMAGSDGCEAKSVFKRIKKK